MQTQIRWGLIAIFVAFCIFFYVNQKNRNRREERRERRKERHQEFLNSISNSREKDSKKPTDDEQNVT